MIETWDDMYSPTIEAGAEITHNLGSENVVVTVAASYDDFYATSHGGSTTYGYSITDANNIRLHNADDSSLTFRYTVTRTG